MFYALNHCVVLLSCVNLSYFLPQTPVKHLRDFGCSCVYVSRLMINQHSYMVVEEWWGLWHATVVLGWNQPEVIAVMLWALTAYTQYCVCCQYLKISPNYLSSTVFLTYTMLGFVDSLYNQKERKKSLFVSLSVSLPLVEKWLSETPFLQVELCCELCVIKTPCFHVFEARWMKAYSCRTWIPKA